jgi:DMSO/TMAO reductase YedYZ molybdopterin-dependent catalytic subunit
VLRGGVLVLSGAAFAGCRRQGNEWPDPPPFLTPQDRFYNRLEAKLAEGKWKDVQNAPKMPTPPSAQEWRLSFVGFRQERQITAKALVVLAKKYGQVSYIKTLRCTGDGRGNRLSSTGLWTGVPLIPVLAELGIPKETRRLRVKAFDGFSCNLQSRFTHGRDGRPAMLATHLNGEPLLADRGGPCRLLIPDRYGFKNIKWPTEILVSPEDVAWGDHEVDKGEGEDDGLVRFASKILSPNVLYDHEALDGRAGTVRLQGMAFGGLAPIASIRLRINKGDWQDVVVSRPAELDSVMVQQAPGLILPDWPITEVAIPWTAELELPAGSSRIEVMATNTLDEEQPETDDWRRDGDSSWAWVELRLS